MHKTWNVKPIVWRTRWRSVTNCEVNCYFAATDAVVKVRSFCMIHTDIRSQLTSKFYLKIFANKKLQVYFVNLNIREGTISADHRCVQFSVYILNVLRVYENLFKLVQLLTTLCKYWTVDARTLYCMREMRKWVSVLGAQRYTLAFVYIKMVLQSAAYIWYIEYVGQCTYTFEYTKKCYELLRDNSNAVRKLQMWWTKSCIWALASRKMPNEFFNSGW